MLTVRTPGPADDSAVASIKTGTDDVCDLFLQAPAARPCYEGWLRDPRRERVREVVLRHETRVLYRLSLSDVHATCRRTTHALGQIKWAKIQRVKPARDWWPTFPFTHLLHYQLERMGGIPRWEEFWDFLRNTSDGQRMLGDDASVLEQSLMRDGVVPADNSIHAG